MAVPPLATQFQLPLTSAGTITNGYGEAGGLSTLPTYKHMGVDWGGYTGKPVLAAANGVVVTASFSAAFGNYVVVEHLLASGTKIYTLYGHMSSLSVSSGQTILMGTQLGGMGDTGAATGIHLHFEISYVNKFTQAGLYGNGYDSPTEWQTSSLSTVNPLTFINSHLVSTTQNGGANSDYIVGLTTSEHLNGNGGNDTIFGGAGNDSIIGGSGSDFLFGGGGSDSFNFRSASQSSPGNRDIIGDFSAGSDKIDLSAIDGKAGIAGNQSLAYIGTSSFHHVKGELRMSAGVVQGDTNGDGVADFELVVSDGSALIASLTASSFVL